MDAPTLLEVDRLNVRFATPEGEVAAVTDLSLRLAAGSALGIVGESGSGKSQTAFALMRLLAKNGHASGAVRFEGVDLLTLSEAEMNKRRGAQMAMIYQDPMTSLNPYLTVGDQLTEVLRFHKGMSQTAAVAESVRLLDAVKIADAARRMTMYPHEFSGGMRQRVVIAMALLCRPKLLIADEPTTALDVTVQAQILDLLKRLQRETGMAVILITHDLGVVAETCDEVAVMYAGRIAERGPVHEIFAKPLHPYTQGLIRCLPKLDHPPKTDLPVIPGMVPSLKDMPSGCRFASRCPNKHSNDVLTQRQPWKDCGGGHGVEACACFASQLSAS